jgi:Ribonuclease G/E
VSRTLALAVSPGEVWAALTEEGELIGLRVARAGAPDALGAVFLGRIVALRPELPAALIDIGLDRPAFLDARDADKKRGIAGLTEGAALIVEVTKAARADKAAGVRVLRAGDERRQAFETAARSATPPARLDRAEPAAVAAAKPLLARGAEWIAVDDRGALAELRRAFPQLGDRLAFHGATPPLFESLGLAEQIDTVLQPHVPLPQGGAIFIETVHAATMIDVDGGARAALAVDRDAARVIARQIVLRNLAGPIVVDFVGLKKRDEREAVAAALKTALVAEGEQPEILGWTRLGHLELVRPRREAPLAELLLERAPDGALRKTALTLALEALRAVGREAAAQPGKGLALAAHPDIAAVLDGGSGLEARQWLEARLGRKLSVVAEPQRPRDRVDIRAA